MPESDDRSMPDPLVHVFADESCLGNQFAGRARPGGAGGMLATFRDRAGWVRRDYWTSEPDTTNNRMAIRSAILPLRALTRPSRVIFTSDSRYLVDAMTSWIHGWVRKGWKRKAGPVENLELWQELLPVARRHAIEWRWVKGHALHPENEYANDLATRAAREQTESGGLIPSGFDEWIAQEQETKGRYLDYLPTPPEEERFKPTQLPRG